MPFLDAIDAIFGSLAAQNGVKGQSKGKNITSGKGKGAKGDAIALVPNAKGKGKGAKGDATAFVPSAKGKGKGKGAKGKGKAGGAKGDAIALVPNDKGKGKGKDAKGKGGTPETSKQRIPRLAADFAVCVPDLMPEGPTAKEEVQEIFREFCLSAGESSSGFGQILYLLVQWGVLRRAGKNRFKLPNSSLQILNRKAAAALELEDALVGKRPPSLAIDFENPVPKYYLPVEFHRLAKENVNTMQEKTWKLLRRKGLLPKEMQPRRTYLHSVLFAEELQMNFDISIYDLQVEEKLECKNGLHKFWVPGLAEKRPSVLKGDYLLLKCKQGKFKGYVHAVRMDYLEVSFHQDFQNHPPFQIHFSFNRTPLRSMHRAIDDSDALAIKLDSLRAIQRPAPALNAQLNMQQCGFLATCSVPQPAAPLLLWGPPGTGKTTTLVHTIASILGQNPSAKVLVTAPSNPASDLLCERLSQLGIKKDKMFRLVAFMRDARSVPSVVQPFTRMDAMGSFEVPSHMELRQYQVVVCTCTTAAYIRSRLSKEQGSWFTHVFVDEAAQGMEAEALIPLTLAKPDALVCLAGDFKQLGPVIRSPVAIPYGLQMSLMERIVQKITVDHSRVFTLLDTYRSHPSILKLYNKLIYGGVLKCCCPASSYNMESWPACPVDSTGSKHPVIFHHCNGQESRQKDSPSWQNATEIHIVKDYLKQLLDFGIPAEDIGIITPYYKQCQALRMMCQGLRVNVEVGTTELFQGREKRVILMTTVRSSQESEIKNDLRFSLGFLGNCKRTNVALSRAKSLLVVVGNMSLLSHDATWNDAIRLVMERGALGAMCGDRFEMRSPLLGDGSQWGSAQQSAPATEVADGVMDRPWREHL